MLKYADRLSSFPYDKALSMRKKMCRLSKIHEYPFKYVFAGLQKPSFPCTRNSLVATPDPQQIKRIFYTSVIKTCQKVMRLSFSCEVEAIQSDSSKITKMEY